MQKWHKNIYFCAMNKIVQIIQQPKYSYLLYLLVILIIYFQTKDFLFALDDNLVTENVAGKIYSIKDLLHLFEHRYNRVEYRPIALVSFGIEHLLLGEIVPKYAHLINVGLYIIIILSSNFVFNYITKQKYRLEIFWAIMLFSVHPLCTEVVANLKSRDGLISMLFCLWSVYFLIQANRKNNSTKHYLISLLFCVIGSFSKIDIFGIHLFILFYFVSKANKKSIFIGVSILGIFVLITTLLRNTLVNYYIPIEESSSTLAVTTFTENPIATVDGLYIKLLATLQTVWIYIIKIIFPFDLRYYYGYNYYTIETAISYVLIIKMAILVLVFVGVLIISKKNKYIFLGLIGFVSFLFYALNFITSVAGIVADRYTFLALPWFFSTLFILLNTLKLSNKLISNSLFLVITVVLLATSYSRTTVWENSLTLAENDAPKLSQSFEGMRMAANIYYSEYEKYENKEYLEKAIDCATKANKVYPENALVNTQLGQFYFHKNNITLAKKYLQKAAKIDTAGATVLHYLGDIAYIERDYKMAETYYFKAYLLANKSQQQVLINNISTLYFEQNLVEQCLAYNQKLIKEDSANFAALENLGYFYLQQKDTAKSTNYFSLAKRHGLLDGL